jgi:hypothetical protein
VAVLRVEPPIGVEPMTYALRGGSGLSSPVLRNTSSEVAWRVRSARVPSHPASLLAASLARSGRLAI